jgi:preprotein translocase subunit SecB
MSSDGGENKPNLQIIGQYIKDLSFENPGAPASLNANPEMDLGVDLQARPAGPDLFEVVLSLRIRANFESKPLFILELAYAALVRMTNIPEETAQRMLLIQTPYMMYPFARRILADMVRDGGMPPLMIEPIDFATLYQVKMGQAAAAAAAPPPVTA